MSAVQEAIDWLRSYSDEDPYTDMAREARRVADELEAEQKLIQALEEDVSLYHTFGDNCNTIDSTPESEAL